MKKRFHSNGKLLLTGEYVVLDGALSLALPTSYGQSMSVRTTDTEELIWKSFDHLGKIWFEGVFDLHSLKSLDKADKIAGRLQDILIVARQLNPLFLRSEQGYEVKINLDFPRDWGLGSSSTLINNIAQWASVDAHELLWNTFSGSGYDISCAQHNCPILYQLQDRVPKTVEVDFKKPFFDQLYFIHLNKKQNSRDGIAHYKKRNLDISSYSKHISSITTALVSCTTVTEFEALIMEHEKLVSHILGVTAIKERLFPDFKGAIKSLGAWGGDFILAVGHEKEMDYFLRKGFTTIIPYTKMIL